MRVVQNGPCASQRSICGLRSLPQKGSPSTTKKGAPNTPAAMASSLARFRRAFHAGSFQAASARCRVDAARSRQRLQRPGLAEHHATREVGAQSGARPGCSRVHALAVVEPPEHARGVLRRDRELHRLHVGHAFEARRAAEVVQAVFALDRVRHRALQLGRLEGRRRAGSRASAPCGRAARPAPRPIRRRCTNTATRSRSRSRSASSRYRTINAGGGGVHSPSALAQRLQRISHAVQPRQPAAPRRTAPSLAPSPWSIRWRR